MNLLDQGRVEGEVEEDGEGGELGRGVEGVDAHEEATEAGSRS